MKNPHTFQLSSQPPSSRWCLSKNSHPFLNIGSSRMAPQQDTNSRARTVRRRRSRCPSCPPVLHSVVVLYVGIQLLPGGSSWKRVSDSLKVWVSSWDSPNISSSVLGVVFPEDRECCGDWSRGLWAVVLDHNSTCNIFRCVRSETPLSSRTENPRRVKQLKPLWPTDQFVTRESPIGILYTQHDVHGVIHALLRGRLRVEAGNFIRVSGRVSVESLQHARGIPEGTLRGSPFC